ncbi:MAG: Mpo1-like protein [Wenzhouxiangella sp.]
MALYQSFASFAEFYPYYLAEHADVRCRRMHFIGSWLVLLALVLALIHSPWWLLAMPLFGYGFAWLGHFLFEKNRPATFKYPFYSLLGDWVMFSDILRGRVRI